MAGTPINQPQQGEEMEQRELGRSGLRVSRLALGGNVFGWTADEATSFRVLDAFVDAGGNCIDTADVYSRWAPGHQGGESETVLGKWLRKSGKRDKVVLATKVGKDMGDGKKGLKPEYIRQAVQDSLKRLQTDHIDLYQSHEDDPETPLAETLGAFGELIRAGKVRAIGASNYTGVRLAESLRVSGEQNLPRYESLQPQYNLVERVEYETTYEPIVVKQQLGCISYFSLAAGFLTGKYRTPDDVKGKARGGLAGKYLNPQGYRVLQALDEVAAAYKSKPAKVALAWLIARPSVTAPIASATSLEQLKDLVEATDLKLDSASIEKLNQASEVKVAASH
jgi:aryl-alcohol dehydrogenase-like predicted oxidoreductase